MSIFILMVIIFLITSDYYLPNPVAGDPQIQLRHISPDSLPSVFFTKESEVNGNESIHTGGPRIYNEYQSQYMPINTYKSQKIKNSHRKLKIVSEFLL